MFKKFKPDQYYCDVHKINYQKLKKQGIKVLCFDLDNTLDKPDNRTQKINKKTLELLEQLKKSFEVIIVSNNTIEGRVESFAKNVNLPYIKGMKKPFQSKYNDELIKCYNKNCVAFIGDKIITDILGANLYGGESILVDALYPGSRKWYSIIMVIPDYVVKKSISFKKGKYYERKK